MQYTVSIHTVPPPVLTISSFPPSVVPMAGEEYLLSCNVTVFEGVLAPIEISWADPTGKQGAWLHRCHAICTIYHNGIVAAITILYTVWQ